MKTILFPRLTLFVYTLLLSSHSSYAQVFTGDNLPGQSLTPVYAAEQLVTFDGKARILFNNAAGVNLPIAGNNPWTINLFLFVTKKPENLTILGGFGDDKDKTGTQRYLIESNNGISFWGSNIDVESRVGPDLNTWQMLTVTYNGHIIRLYKNGREIKNDAPLLPDPSKANNDTHTLKDAAPKIGVGIMGPWWRGGHLLDGKIAGFTIWNKALQPEFLKVLLGQFPLLQPVFTYRESSTDSDGTTVFAGTATVKEKVGINVADENIPVDAVRPWTINMFVYTDIPPADLTLVGGFGDTKDVTGSQRYIIAHGKGISFWGSNIDLLSEVPFDLNKWQMITATYDGRVIRLYKNAVEIKNNADTQDDPTAIGYKPTGFINNDAQVNIATRGNWQGREHLFRGKIAGFTIWNQALQPVFLQSLLINKPK